VILSASRRTDIPAFYSDWLLNRVHQGYAMVRNPMNSHSVSKINITPEVVDAIVLWTKNPERLIPRLQILRPYTYYFQFTITPYGQQLEPNVPNKREVVELFRLLSREIGPERVIWRYDPIILTRDMDLQFHRESFDWMAQMLAGYTRRCVVSFVDLYRKSQRNLLAIPLKEITSRDMLLITQSLVDIASKHRIEVVTCAEDIDLTPYGVRRGKCIDDKLISELSGRECHIPKDEYQRPECGCVASIDIGAYNTCPHGCLYCYANYSAEAVKKNLSMHNASSPLLVGDLGPTDRVSIRRVKSCVEVQKGLL
jgi:hypothetical protein